MCRQSLAWIVAIIALAGTTIGRSDGIVEGEPPSIFVMCDDTSERSALIEYGKGFDSIGTYDCIALTEQGSIFVHRYVAVLRRVLRVQVLLPDGSTETPDGRWWKDSRKVDTLPQAIAAAGIAVGDDGRTVYVTGVASAQLVVFDRSPETGWLSFREARNFATESECTDFLAGMRKAWLSSRAMREERRRQSYPDAGIEPTPEDGAAHIPR
jgi:hypothetical protein